MPGSQQSCVLGTQRPAAALSIPRGLLLPHGCSSTEAGPEISRLLSRPRRSANPMQLITPQLNVLQPLVLFLRLTSSTQQGSVHPCCAFLFLTMGER